VSIDAKLRAAASAPEKDVTELVNRLAAEARVKPPRFPNLITPDGQEVVLDVEVEGFRCILLRLQPLGVSSRAAMVARLLEQGTMNRNLQSEPLDRATPTVRPQTRRP
jgi:hypothetical protein